MRGHGNARNLYQSGQLYRMDSIDRMALMKRLNVHTEVQCIIRYLPEN